jgi:endonuclease YncB( thermonuclease family)
VGKATTENPYENNSYLAQVVRWVDGDTVVLSVDLGFSISVTEKFRLARINAPEVKKYSHVTQEEKERGIELKHMLEEKLPPGRGVVVSVSKRGKYSRYIAEIWYVENDGERHNLNDWLLNNNLVEGVAY